MSTDIYFAAEQDPTKFGGLLIKKVDEDRAWAQSSDIRERLERCYRYYYGISVGGAHATSAVRRGGDQGELAEVRVNHSRALAQTLFNLIAANKYSWQPVATNSDYSSTSQAVLAQNILEYYWSDGRVGQFCERSLEESIPFTESFLLTEWDETMGEEYAVDEMGQVVKTGDIRFTNVMAWDVVRDPVKASYEDLDWIILRIRRNKFDLAKRYAKPPPPPQAPTPPQMPQEPVPSGDPMLDQSAMLDHSMAMSDFEAALGEHDAAMGQYSQDLAAHAQAVQASQDLYDRITHMSPDQNPADVRRLYELGPTHNDDVDCYYFFHKPTAAVPEGRQTVFLNKDLVLADGKLEYNFWPVHRVVHSELHGTPFAYSPYIEILGIQEELDSLETSICTNQTAFGTHNVILEMGSEIQPDMLTGGMRFIYKAPNTANPEVLKLLGTPHEIFEHVESLKRDMELLMGLNQVVRGQPQTGDQSGSALALLQAQAVQQSSSLQSNYVRFIQSVGNAILELIRTRCPLPRRIAISGKANQFLQKEQSFTGESIGQIRKVMVEIGNPLSQTAAGRIQLAQELMANKLIKTPEQYIQVLTTGRLEPLTQATQNEMLLILKENEQILGGIQPICSVDDDHQIHAREHRGVIANPEARMDDKIREAYMAHILEHEELYFTTDPRRLALMGQTPPPMMPPGMPPMGAGPAGPGAAPPPGVPGKEPSSAGPSLPAMPVDPSTGRQAQAPAGALGRTDQAPPGPKGPAQKPS